MCERFVREAIGRMSCKPLGLRPAPLGEDDHSKPPSRRLACRVATVLLVAASLTGCGSNRSADVGSSPAPSGASRTTTGNRIGTPANLAPPRSEPPRTGACSATSPAEPLLPCGDVPPGLLPDPRLSASSCQVVAASTTDCVRAVSEGFEAGPEGSPQAVLVSTALSLYSESAAEAAVISIGHGISGLQASSADPAAPPASPTQVVALLTWRRHVGAIGLQVIGNTLLEVYMREIKTLPSALKSELTAPDLIVRLVNDQVRQLQRVGPPT